jgi:hypothetical protein
MPYSERPSELPLDIEECRTALWKSRGNISTAAAVLKVTPQRLRSFVKNSPRLLAEQEEAREQLVDKAEDVAYAALDDASDPSRQDQMARYVMTNLGRSRGYSSGGSGVSLNLPKGNLIISWADGTPLNESEKTIDGELVDAR